MMLKSLEVRNFTIIKEASLEFDSGMSTITGETGTGKSILIGALGLALGQRAQSHHLNQADRLSITLNFDLSDLPAVQTWLEENDLASGHECILQRTLTQDGRSRSRINGTQVALMQLQKLGSQLVEIVGQNAHQSLMQPDEQLAIIDMQCKHHDALKDMRHLQKQWVALSGKLDRRRDQRDDLTARTALLEYQIGELREFDPVNDEFTEIEQSYKRLSKKELLQQQIHKALELLEESESHDVVSKTSEAIQTLKPLADTDEGISTAIAQLDIALNHVQIASQEIRDCLEQIDVDEAEYRQLEERLQGYFDLSGKYEIQPEKLAELYQKLQDELDEIQAPDTSVEEMQRQRTELKTRYSILAEAISKRRKVAATTLSRQITQTLHKLNMQSAGFDVRLLPRENDTPSRHGNERTGFFIRTNPDHPPTLLTQIASGGELSRISLALQAASAMKNRTPTLIFDEVDAGVGGKTAEMVGKLLKTISRNAQVFCITHLPQIAAQADHHFTVDKQQQKQRTCVTVKKLLAVERRREIARMAAGARITEKSLAHADEMLNRDRKNNDE